MSDVGYFRFEVRPWTYQTGETSVRKELHVTVEYNGRIYDINELMWGPEPYETALEHYSRLAISALHEMMRQEPRK